jgi:hypothetical protein
LDLQLPTQSVPLTTKSVSFNPAQARCTRYNIIIAAGRLFSPGTPGSSTNKIDRYDITEILLNVALSILILTITSDFNKHFFVMNSLGKSLSEMTPYLAISTHGTYTFRCD